MAKFRSTAQKHVTVNYPWHLLMSLMKYLIYEELWVSKSAWHFRHWNVLVIQQELSLQRWKLQNKEIKSNLYKAASSNARSGLRYPQTVVTKNYRSLVLLPRRGVTLPCSTPCTITGLWGRHCTGLSMCSLNNSSEFKAASYRLPELKAIFTCSICPSG